MTSFPEVVLYVRFLHGNSSSSTWYLEHRTFHQQRQLGPRQWSLTPTDQIGLSSTKKWLDTQTIGRGRKAHHAGVAYYELWLWLRVRDGNWLKVLVSCHLKLEVLKERPAAEMVRTCHVNAGRYERTWTTHRNWWRRKSTWSVTDSFSETVTRRDVLGRGSTRWLSVNTISADLDWFSDELLPRHHASMLLISRSGLSVRVPGCQKLQITA